MSGCTSIVVSARGWFAAGPPPAILNFSAPPAVAQQAKDQENRTLELRVVDRQSRAPIAEVEGDCRGRPRTRVPDFARSAS